MQKEWQRWRDTPRISGEQELERIREESAEWARRKKRHDDPFGLGLEDVPFEFQLVGLGVVMFFFFMAVGIIL